MTADERAERIRAWHAAKLRFRRAWDLFATMTGVDEGAPIANAILLMADAYTDAVAFAIDDEGGWLQWWEDECDFGSKPLRAGTGGEFEPIRTIEQVIHLIEDRTPSAAAPRSFAAIVAATPSLARLAELTTQPEANDDSAD